MSDRRLLEMAAKAAGVDFDGFSFMKRDRYSSNVWEPLHSNDDALRLALKLGLCIQPITECDTVQVYQIHSITGEPFNIHTAANGDIELRIIIVQAAAEIGRQMIN